MRRTINAIAFAIAGSLLLPPRMPGYGAEPVMAAPDHIVVAIMENHTFSQIIDSGDAPFIRDLARHGATFTESFAVAHPSQPNYFALFSGSTHDVTDDGYHAFDAPTLAGALGRINKTFIGYVERGSPRKHNPWESFRESQDVERSISEFPHDFTRLPTVSFVVPNQQNDMHDGSVEQGDAWLRQHLGDYAEWCIGHNSLLIITFDESSRGADNRIATIFVGANVVPGQYHQSINHYGVLRTISAMYGLPPLARSAFEPPVVGIWRAQ